MSVAGTPGGEDTTLVQASKKRGRSEFSGEIPREGAFIKSRASLTPGGESLQAEAAARHAGDDLASNLTADTTQESLGEVAKVLAFESESEGEEGGEEAEEGAGVEFRAAVPSRGVVFAEIPLPDDDYDLTDLDGWRVAGSLGMMESERLAGDIKSQIVDLTAKWIHVLESPELPEEVRKHNLRVYTDAMLDMLFKAGKVMYNLSRQGIVTEWLETTLAIASARSSLRRKHT